MDRQSMIVWGGADTVTHRLNTGGRYNPSTNTWVATTTVGAPEARYYHTALWTGSPGNRMIIWAGSNSNPTSLNTGGVYDPAGNTWTATSTGLNVPVARYSQSGVWTGTEMIVWGGYDYIDPLNSGGRYNPTADTWVPTSSDATLPAGRSGHSVVWTGNEAIVWGGRAGGTYSYTQYDEGSRYNPATDSWTETGEDAYTPYYRFDHAAVWTGTEMIVWGGSTGTSSFENTGGRYNPMTDGWTATSTGANVPSPRSSHTALWTGTEMIVWGGSSGSGAEDTGGRYDPSTDTWTPTSTGVNVPSARSSHTAVWAGTEMIVWGGKNASFSLENTGGRYNPSTDTWTPTSTGLNVPSARHHHAAAWTGTRMIVWGGDGASGSPENPLKTGGRYDPSGDTWAPTSIGASVPAARFSHTAVWTGVEVIVWGGATFVYGSTNTGGRYNPSTDQWTSTSTTDAPSARSSHGAAWTGEDMIVWGGDPTTSTGGRYCASCNAGTWYHDVDGDGFGDPAGAALSCGPPSGYVTMYRARFPGHKSDVLKAPSSARRGSAATAA